MALVLKDRVKETTTSTGTGTINLAGAATGFEDFVSAVGDGNTCYYAILDANGSAWEVGIGTVTDAATDTLSRDTILESSNNDNAISLTSGTHTVFLTYPADKSVYRNSNDQIVATASGIVFSDSTVQTTAPVDTNTTYTAGSGLQLDSTTFNAKTATTSASGITTLTNTIDSTQTKALTPKAVDDAGYGTMSNFILEDGDGTEVTISNAKEVKFVEGSGIDIDWTDVSDGSDSDPYDLTFTVDHDAASNFVANEHVDHTSVTLTAGSGLSGGGDISSNRTFNALTATTGVAGITTLTNTINGDQDKALTPKAVNDAAYLTAHPSISAASSSNNSGRTYIQDLLLDSNGHVTGVATAAETVTDTNTTYTGGTNLTLAGTTFNVDDAFLVNDADDTTTGTITAGGLSTAGLVSLGESTYQHKFDRYRVTGVTSGNPVNITFGGSALSDHYSYKIRCYDELSSNLNGSVFLVRENNSNDGWDVKTVSIQKNSAGEFPEVFDDGGTVKVKTSATGVRDIIVYNEAIFINRNDVTGFIWGGDHIWSKVTNAAGTIDNIYTSGNVGINTETPAYPLDVNGTGNFAGIRFSDGTTQSTAGGGGGISHDGSTADGVLTYKDSDEATVESNLTFNGSTLTVAGVADITDTTDASDATGDTGALRCEGGASIAKKLYVGTDLDVDGTTNLDAVDIDGNVQLDGTLTVGVNDTGKDVKFYGATNGSYLEWDESEDRLNLVGGAYVNEAVPANDTPTTEDATVTLDLSLGNYHNIVLGANVTKFEFTNAKRGQKFILRITQHASSAKTVSWSNVDSDTGGTAATVRWAGNITPTMSTSTSHTDVYGFLCTNNAGSNFDGFIIGQDLPD